MGNYGWIITLLRQGWLMKQKIMHYGLFEQCTMYNVQCLSQVQSTLLKSLLEIILLEIVKIGEL